MTDWTYFDPETRRARQHVSATREPAAIDGLNLMVGRWPADAYRLGVNGRVYASPLKQKGPRIAAVMVKREAARRLAPTDWMALRALESGEVAALADEVRAERATIRAASNRIEKMKPIPADFRDDKYWGDEWPV